MASSETTLKYPSIADVLRDLTLFFKLDNNSPLSLADLTKIAEGRWEYFKNNWDFIKGDYLARINSLQDSPGKTAALYQFDLFTELVDSSRSSTQNPLSNPATLRKFKDLLDNIYITDIQVTQSEQELIDRELRRIASLKKEDFYQMRERVRITHDKVTDSLGLGDENYNKLLGRVGSPQIISFRFQDFKVLESLISLQNTVTSLIPTTLVQNERPDPFSVVRAALNNPAIPMNSSQSGFLIPFPAGSTLERLAAQYLGDADRWLEIAVANGLEFPYVDEVGEKVMMLINGIGNTAIVPLNQAPNFAVDDEVFLGSAAKPLSRRKIIKLEEDKNNEHLIITVNGNADLAAYTTAQRAFVFHYKRNTVNADKFIMIPAPGDVGFPINAQLPWFVKDLPQDLRNVGVDLALDEKDDLVFDNTGDLQLVYGLANAAQAASLKVKIKTRDLLRNPDFGIQEIAGRLKNNEVSENLLLLIIETALGGDDRFEGTNGFGFAVTDSAVFINTSVKLAGSGGSLPLTFQLPKG